MHHGAYVHKFAHTHVYTHKYCNQTKLMLLKLITCQS